MEYSPLFTCLLLISCCCLLALLKASEGNDQILYLNKLIEAQRSLRASDHESADTTQLLSDLYVGPQEGLMEADKIQMLPGQPEGVLFNQYAGYVTVDPVAGRALFYYFVEASEDPSTKPLVLWMNGGPGCSSLGYGAMEELGPFRVNSDGKTLSSNKYSWNSVANVLFLESPAGVGFSYSNTTSDYNLSGDKRSASDAYTFLINWFERFPQYKGRDFFLTGESYAGHYVPQLGYTIVVNNNNTRHTAINFKGIAIGNAWIDYDTNSLGMFDYFWTHALNSDEVNAAIHAKCNFSNESRECLEAQSHAMGEKGDVNIYNIYAPLCHGTNQTSTSTGSAVYFDPCSDNYVFPYLNLPQVQNAFHAKPTSWDFCSKVVGFFNWNDSPDTVLPTIKQLIDNGINFWMYSGDMDGRVPITSTRYSVNKLGFQVEEPWRVWYPSSEVGGYVEKYKGLTLVTIRGAGHMVPSDQPERALTMFASFLRETLHPST